MKNKANYILPIVAFIFIIIVWYLCIVIWDIPKYVIPSPSNIIHASIENINNIINNLYVTAKESALGLLLGSSFAIIVGVLMAQYKIFAKISLPYLIASNTVPVIAISPILILWVGNGLSAKVLVAAFLCFFPLSMNTFKGLNDYPKSFENLFALYGASKWDFFWKFKMYNARNYLFTGFRLNASFCVIGSIVAEIISSNKGLGYGILQSTYSLDIPLLWGYIIVACILGLMFYSIILIIEKIILKYIFL